MNVNLHCILILVVLEGAKSAPDPGELECQPLENVEQSYISQKRCRVTTKKKTNLLKSLM